MIKRKRLRSPLFLGIATIIALAILNSCVITAVAASTLLNKSKRDPQQLYISDTIPEMDKKRQTEILSAFFGLDNGLNKRTKVIYKEAPGKDGMPLVFSHELDPESLEGADFAVTTRDGSVHVVEAASLLPANEEFELKIGRASCRERVFPVV